MAGRSPTPAGHRQVRKVSTEPGSVDLMNASGGLLSRAGQPSAHVANGPTYDTKTLAWLVNSEQPAAVCVHLASFGNMPAERRVATRFRNVGSSSSDAICTMKPLLQAMSSRGPPIGSGAVVVVATVVTVVAGVGPGLGSTGSPLLAPGPSGAGLVEESADEVAEGSVDGFADPAPTVGAGAVGVVAASPATGRSLNHSPTPANSSSATARTTNATAPRPRR